MHGLLFLCVLAACVGHGAHECEHAYSGGYTPTHEDTHSQLRHDPEVAMEHQRYIEQRRAGKLTTRAGAFQPMRFRVEYLTVADAYTCYNDGDFAYIGDNAPPSGNTPRCTPATLTTECFVECSTDDTRDTDGDGRPDTANVLTTAKDVFMRDIIDEAITWISNTISVDPVIGPLTAAAGKCGVKGGADVPANVVSPGVTETDMVLLVTARPTVGSLLAYAGPCRQEAVTKRPIMGHLNVAPNGIDLLPGGVSEWQRKVLIHELFHALGFTNSYYSQFFDPATNSTVATDPVTSISVGPAPTYTQDAINTPLVVQEARAHFGCPTMTSVPLENGGGTGTVGSHWEKRVVHNELMSGTITDEFDEPRMSRLSLALMEDSGWYQVDYAAADPLGWGKDEGCSFVLNKCDVNNWPSGNYACVGSEYAPSSGLKVEPFCNYDRSGTGFCTLGDPSDPFVAAVNYVGRQTGNQQLYDYCPIIKAYSNGFCKDVSNNDAGKYQWFESYSKWSACYVSDAADLDQSSRPKARCYREGCTAAGTLRVQVGHQWFDCNGGGQKHASTDYFVGQVTCPAQKFLDACSPATGTFPTVTGVNPNMGTVEGGLAVTITGSGFHAGMYADVGGIACASVTYNSPTTIVCQQGQFLSPTEGGVMDVTVITNEGKLGFLAGGFELENPNEDSGASIAPLLLAILSIVLSLVL